MHGYGLMFARPSGSIDLYGEIKCRCSLKGITIAQMCRDIGIRQGLISDLKHGRSRTISIAKLQKIADYFEISVDRLLGRDSEEMIICEPKKPVEPFLWQVDVLRGVLHYHERMMLHRDCPAGDEGTVCEHKVQAGGRCPNSVFIDSYAEALKEAIRCMEIVHKDKLWNG